ncbi:secretion system protein [Salinigranum rubrum]|uniref:Secretion system protein n=1 Tax=Salinigranum rubrum TaxID=755307 RepID=A0A2I8VHG3_9EURY|nr:type II secretion system F family protein [Salinigranum rubrum]AUV81365.1 secretion system protein [Salinigranum rubrum]
MVLLLVPLVLVALLGAFVALTFLDDRLDRLLTRMSLRLFGSLLDRDGSRRRREVERMRAAHVDQTYGRFASRTLFVSTALGVVGAVGVVYVGGLLLVLLDVRPTALASAAGLSGPAVGVFFAGDSVAQVTVLGLLGSLVVAVLALGLPAAVVGYWGRWLYLDQVASARANRIDTTLPRTVAFIYALSRSGMPFPKVLETLAANREVYGEAAEEFAVAVRDTNTFGTDIITALEDTARRTPSDGLEEFAENLASVLGSGRALSSFLHEQYERYQDEIAAQQQTYLELLETFAEIYVTVLVAGPLFFITVLVVIGLVISDTLPLIQVVTYLGIPLASVAFIVYIDSITDSLRASSWQSDLDIESEATGEGLPGHAAARTAATDGGTADADAARDARNYAQLRAYDRAAPIRAWLDDPKGKLLQDPIVTLYLTIPVALVWVALTFDRTVVFTTGVPTMQGLQAYRLVDVVDKPLVEALLLVMGLLSLVYELRKRTYRDIENATPDFLDRMASVNEAGLTVVSSIKRVSQTDLGALGTELRRAHRDIEYGADVASALQRMANRTRAPMLTRSVALVTNAMGASGDISPVLRIAANETEDTRSLREERRQQMLTYLVVIYVSFFVFLGIIVALTVSFVPAIESASQSAAFSGDSVASSSVFSGLGEVNTDAYSLLFFHVTLVQGVFSGLIAGQLGEGSVADGLKHATLLVFVTYVVFQIV